MGRSNSYNVVLLLCLAASLLTAYAGGAVLRMQAVRKIVHDGTQMPWMNGGAGVEQAAAVTAAINEALEEQRLVEGDWEPLSTATHLPFCFGHAFSIGVVAFLVSTAV